MIPTTFRAPAPLMARARIGALGLGGLLQYQQFVALCEEGIARYVLGTEMDYVDNEIKAEFVFNNPNAKGECGCGESFHV